MLYSKAEVAEKIEKFLEKSPEEKLKFPIFCNLKLPDMEIRGITFENAFFENLEVENFNFFNCIFKNCKFIIYSERDLNFNYCKFDNCDFRSGGVNVKLYKSEIISSTVMNDGECLVSESKLFDSKTYVNVNLIRSELNSCIIHGSIHDLARRFIYNSKLNSCAFNITFEDLGCVPPYGTLINNSELINCGFDYSYIHDCSIESSRLENCSFVNGSDTDAQRFKLISCTIKNLIEDRTYSIERIDCTLEDSDINRGLSIIESALKDAGVDTRSLTIGNNSIQVWGSTIWIPNTDELLKDGSLLDSYVKVIQKIEKDRGF